jgi:hypothetical protein
VIADARSHPAVPCRVGFDTKMFGPPLIANLPPHRLTSALDFGGCRMTDKKFLTAEEVSERYRGEVTVGTLRNWRAMRIGPAFVKIGKAVLYPVAELESWDKDNLVRCRAFRCRTAADDDRK